MLNPAENLNASVEFTRGVLDALSTHVAILDAEGNIVAVNEAWNRFATANGTRDINAEQGAFVGSNYLRVCESAEGDCSREAGEMASGLRSVLSGATTTFEYEYPCHAPQEKRWFVGRVSRLDYAERPYLVVAHENITSRVLSERAMHETEERYRNLVENAGEYAIMTLDKDGIITGWNPGATAIFDYAEREIIGRSARILFPPDARDQGVFERERETARVHGRSSDDRYMMRRDGSLFFADGVTFAVYDDDDNLTGFGKLLRDFTERHQSEQAIKELNARLHRLMVETHHRVKNNLQIISALIDLERMHRPNSEMDAELARLGTRVMAMAGVHALLTQSSRHEGASDYVSARAILETLLANITALIGARSLTTELDDIALSIQQGTSLALITNELVLNALKYGRSEVGVTFRVEGNACRLIIRDDGPGFPLDFAPDLNADIGLELINGLVQMDLGGVIHYANRADKSGAEVTITFPI